MDAITDVIDGDGSVVDEELWGFDPGLVDSGEGFDEDGRPVGNPWAERALSTTSHPFSRVRIRSFSSSFSLSRARSCSARTRSSCSRL